MKKISLLFVIIFYGAIIFAQNVQSIQEVSGSNGSGRAVTDLVCPGSSLYSQTPDGINGISTADGNLMYDDILTTPAGPVLSITFWMIEAAAINPLTVDIIFRHDDGGGLPGSIFASYNSVALTGVNTGETSFGYPVMEYTYIFPTGVTVTAGDWVGIADYPDDAGNFHHYWASSAPGNSISILYPSMANVYGFDLAFCLTGSSQIPLSNWPIILGILLISAFLVIRFRRRMLA